MHRGIQLGIFLSYSLLALDKQGNSDRTTQRPAPTSFARLSSVRNKRIDMQTTDKMFCISSLLAAWLPNAPAPAGTGLVKSHVMGFVWCQLVNFIHCLRLLCAPGLLHSLHQMELVIPPWLATNCW
ncbi:hypothetical protein QBC36DRAFT_8115 [Triangularia setosa]|uniref:Secreted protein n=1 Tax=Triangularia setosa TaxID=2587417 RepID=A0AAN7A7T9_9PEZI|nr:hypothetical protein QBC36DRAFT_8115 [Podospora setosa]